MSKQYHAQLDHFKFRKLQIDAKNGTESDGSIVSQLRFSLREPTSQDDNTVLIDVSGKVYSEDHALEMNCEAEFIYAFDEIPEDWMDAVTQCGITTAQKDLIEKLEIILNDMGIPLHFSQT